MKQQTQDIAIETAKGAPAVAGAVAASMTLNEWVAVATGIYILVQIAYLVRKWWREEHEPVRRQRRRSEE